MGQNDTGPIKLHWLYQEAETCTKTMQSQGLSKNLQQIVKIWRVTQFCKSLTKKNITMIDTTLGRN